MSENGNGNDGLPDSVARSNLRDMVREFLDTALLRPADRPLTCIGLTIGHDTEDGERGVVWLIRKCDASATAIGVRATLASPDDLRFDWTHGASDADVMAVVDAVKHPRIVSIDESTQRDVDLSRNTIRDNRA